MEALLYLFHRVDNYVFIPHLLSLAHHPTYLDILVQFCRKKMYGVKPQILGSGMSNVEAFP